jgi:hypothetical protein
MATKFDLRAYRLDHPESRATGRFTFYGSTGSVRRYTCVCCRRVVDTESGKWAPTQHARVAMAVHACPEAEPYLVEVAVSAGVACDYARAS